MNTVVLGKTAEALAARLLAAHGYRILERNVRARFGEIDLVAQDRSTLCLVEIKSRCSLEKGFPEEGVTWRKRQKLIRLASWYLQSRHLSDRPVRFDVVSLLISPDGLPARTRLIKGAFAVDG